MLAIPGLAAAAKSEGVTGRAIHSAPGRRSHMLYATDRLLAQQWRHIRTAVEDHNAPLVVFLEILLEGALAANSRLFGALCLPGTVYPGSSNRAVQWKGPGAKGPNTMEAKRVRFFQTLSNMINARRRSN
eukprot:12248352-Alexandrium_andersonii.AAC.1